MVDAWEDFIGKVEVPSPGEAIVSSTIAWFKDKLQVAYPVLAEGYSEILRESDCGQPSC